MQLMRNRRADGDFRLLLAACPVVGRLLAAKDKMAARAGSPCRHVMACQLRLARNAFSHQCRSPPRLQGVDIIDAVIIHRRRQITRRCGGFGGVVKPMIIAGAAIGRAFSRVFLLSRAAVVRWSRRASAA